MHPVNRFLCVFGVRLSRVTPEARVQTPTAASGLSESFLATFERNYAVAEREASGLDVFRYPCDESGTHPTSYIDHECAFASEHIGRTRPESILDVGSYRQWILGLLAHHRVATLDVRSRAAELSTETVVTCDAKAIELPDASFDAVTSLCALEHFGLGRYGDAFDLNADQKAIAEMIRVLRPGGRLIFSTTVTNGRPAIAFNSYRIYSHAMLREFCAGLCCEDERIYSFERNAICAVEDATSRDRKFDVYLGCWQKP